MARKLYFLIPCLMMALVAFTGCSDEDNDGQGGEDVLSTQVSDLG